jgi:hypothetical protein
MKLPTIQGREIVPVRLIPIITNARPGHRTLPGILANRLNIGGWHYSSDFDEIEVAVYDEETDCTERTTKTRAELIGPQKRDNGVAAYHLNDDGKPVKMRASEWRVIYHEISILEPVLREVEKKNGVYQSMESVWRLKATKILPPGVFLWREDLDLLLQAHIGYYGYTQFEPPDFREGVNYDAFIRPEYQKLIWEGFEHLRQDKQGKMAICLVKSEIAQRIKVSYADFITLCRVHDPVGFASWLTSASISSFQKRRFLLWHNSSQAIKSATTLNHE